MIFAIIRQIFIRIIQWDRPLRKKFSQNMPTKKLKAGEIVRIDIDMIIGNDITTPISIRAFEESGVEKLARPDNFCIVMDHYIPAKDIASANQAKISREFAYKHNLKKIKLKK